MLVNGMDFWMSIKSPCTVGGSVFKWMNDNWQKVMVTNGEEGLECVGGVNEMRLERVSEFIYLGCVWDESGTDKTECSRKMPSGRKMVVLLRLYFMVWVCSLSLLGSWPWLRC